jgi:hypothetical protein
MNRRGILTCWEERQPGEESAFGDIFRRHARSVYNHCFRRLASWSAAEDATSRTDVAGRSVRDALALRRAGAEQETTGSPHPGGEYPVPPLAACTLHNGIAAVFPGDDRTCLTLGLPRLS